MSLHWNVSNVRDYEELFGKDGELLPVPKMLVFATMGVGLGEITEKNVPEFYARLALIDKLDGPFITDGAGRRRVITVEDVQRHVGLYTNVKNETRATFLRRFGNDLNQYVGEAKRKLEANKEGAAA